MSEKIESLEGSLSEAASEVHLWKSFMEHPAWPRFTQMLEQQRKSRLLVLEAPLGSMSKIMEQEFMKGEGSGLGLASVLPQAQLEMAELEHKRLVAQLELEKDDDLAKISTTKSRVDDPDFSRER